MSAALNAVARDLQKSLAIERMINFDPSPFLATAGYCLFFWNFFFWVVCRHWSPCGDMHARFGCEFLDNKILIVVLWLYDVIQ